MPHRLPRVALGFAAVLVLIAGAACSRAEAPKSTSAGFCADWFRLAGESTKFAQAQGSTGQPGALRSSVESTTVYLKTLADNAPAEIKADFTVYAEWWSEFSKQMARVNYDFTKVANDPAIQQAMSATSEPRFTQASANISAWVQQHCTPTGTTGASTTTTAPKTTR